MNKEELHRFVQYSTGNESNICQIYVIQDGEAVYEDCWHGFRTDDAMHVASVTKGVMALLTGISIDKGYIQGVDQKVLDFFPGYAVKRGEKTIYDVTIRHLLTMTAPYKYRFEPWKKVCTSDDWTKAALDLLGGRAGITGEFKYASLGVQILTGIIENATGERCIDFANKNLFLPLGIPEHVIHGSIDKDDQFNYLMNKRPRKYEWFSDPQDAVTAGWGLCSSAKDLAKIGEMILNDGKAPNDSLQLVSSEWLKEMTASHQKLGKNYGYMSYGYLWWKPHDGRDVVAAIGDGGNVIYVDKERSIAVGVTGTFKPRIFDRVDFIEKKVLNGGIIKL